MLQECGYKGSDASVRMNADSVSHDLRRRISAATPFDGNLKANQREPSVSLEHVPDQLNDFSGDNMRQVIDLERFLRDRIILFDRRTL
jgi:hypothetical protein